MYCLIHSMSSNIFSNMKSRILRLPPVAIGWFPIWFSDWLLDPANIISKFPIFEIPYTQPSTSVTTKSHTANIISKFAIFEIPDTQPSTSVTTKSPYSTVTTKSHPENIISKFPMFEIPDTQPSTPITPKLPILCLSPVATVRN